ncbi:SDR family oxidoreductase [Pontibaca methylaminivorans]|uniref:NADP-dependent 3-hydroxy acid dehydrogenase YdfG n=1 Tax=Pontibaca methylaminivorans TaxID=515897 RepID=A0A1R3WVY2_9RHOB|nr:SDR family oxidoreductase [Pontibaca methylaminivorans]SIT82194.1 NADP-dependent 3-hydroxy acid dehydrogenase YdfG [Pontibaca methylaminivorans]
MPAGQTVLITGASRGIGAAAARVFAAAGANVALLARSRDDIEALAREIDAMKDAGEALALACDVADHKAVTQAVESVLARFGRLDILIANAGVIGPIASLAEADADAWGRGIDINLKGVFHAIRAALPPMLAAGRGTVLTISSGAAHAPLEGWSQYCAAKAGALMLTASVDAELRERGIRAMALSPGTVATDMQREIRASGVNRVSRLDWSDHVPPEWPARALLWMCSAASDPYIGQEISLRDPEIRRRAGLA